LDPEVNGKSLALRLLAAMRADRGVVGSAGSAHVLARTLAERAPRRLALDEPGGPRAGGKSVPA
jgi:hypothetical protein